MKNWLVLRKGFWAVAALVGLLVSTANAQTFNSNGNYNTGSKWSTGSVPSGTGTDITISANPTINTSNTIGNVSIPTNGISMTVQTGANLQIGSSVLFNAGTKKSMTVGGNNLQVSFSGGTIEIWGDLTISNNLDFQMNGGQFIIHGNVTMTNNAQLQVSGSGDIIVGGNFTANNNTQIQVSGSGSTIQVTGAFSVGGGSSSIQVSGGGAITASSCSCSGCPVGSSCSGVTLPITLFNFKGFPGHTETTLSWSTASEKNFSYFDIERSSDGEQFESLGTVRGHGNTVDRRDYSFTDIFPVVGNNYYRLRAVDFDGFEQTFNVIAVKYEGQKIMRVYPNPATTSDLNVDFNFSSTGPVAYTVYNLTGAVVATYAAERTLDRDALVSSLPAGTYLLKAFGSDFVLTSRFILK
ncbi:MAG: T9SS type A sorting domain-containing protein [Cyclobacteriaceae bacterium]|nr:T9SS type A sorting domain-containing protein [Cyclobacteriaceae bacterium]